MKTFFLATLMVLLSAESMACTPPLPVAYQRSQLMTVLGSEAFTKALQPMLKKDHMVKIFRVTFEPGVLIELSNQCKIHLDINYLPPESNGQCPSIKNVEATTVCED